MPAHDLASLRTFRAELYDCFTRRADALCDAVGPYDAAGLTRRVREAAGGELARLNPLIAFTVRPRVRARVRPGGGA